MRRIVTRIVLGLLVLLLASAAWLYTPDLSRAELEQRWANPPSTFLEVEGLRLHIRDTGPRDAPAILLLHGFGSSLHTWEDVAAGLEGNHRVVRLDLPGFGLTGPDPTGDYSDARAHVVILALLDRLGVERAHVVGSSMGGRIAWSFAAAHPERMWRLVLMAPDGFAAERREYGVPADVPPLIRLLPYTLPRFLLRWTMAPAFSPDPSLLSGALLDRYHELLRAPGVRRAMVARLEQNILVPPEPLLAQIEAPTLLLWGALDRMVPVTNAEDYLRAMPNARRLVLEGVGHVPMEETPAEVIRAMRDFLE